MACRRVLTELSRPNVRSMRKKMTAQNGAPGMVAMAFEKMCR